MLFVYLQRNGNQSIRKIDFVLNLDFTIKLEYLSIFFLTTHEFLSRFTLSENLCVLSEI